MQYPLFKGARLKVERAEKHINDFDAAFQAFVQGRPYRITSEGRSNPIYYGVAFTKPLPFDIMLIVGDAIHNLRAALDHCVWEMSGPNRGGLTERNKRFIKFNCHEQVVNYESAIQGIVGLSDNAKSFLKKVAAYRGGVGQPFLDLHNLDILDKHAVIMPIVSEIVVSNLRTITNQWGGSPRTDYLSPRKLQVPLIPEGIITGPMGQGGIVYGGAALGAWERGGMAPVFEFHNDITITFDIFFSEVQPFPNEPILPTLLKLRDLVKGMIDAAEEAGLPYGR